jgi:hypothetical protein
MSTQQNELHQSTLVESHNPSTFDERMKLINAGYTLEENKTNEMTDKQFEEKFGLSPKTKNTTPNGGRRIRRKQTKRRRSTKRRRGSKRSRSLKRRK